MAGERAGAKKARPLRKRSKGSLDGREMTEEDKPLVQGVSRELEADRDSRGSEAKLGTAEGMEERHPSGRLAVTCFLGIFVSYFIYGLLQEKMYARAGLWPTAVPVVVFLGWVGAVNECCVYSCQYNYLPLSHSLLLSNSLPQNKTDIWRREFSFFRVPGPLSVRSECHFCQCW